MEASITVSIFGKEITNVTGNLKTGIKVTFNLLVASGYLRFYLRGSEVRLEYYAKIILDGVKKGDVKLFDI